MSRRLQFRAWRAVGLRLPASPKAVADSPLVRTPARCRLGLTGPGVEVVFDVPEPLQETYGLGSTPEIIVLSPQSRVLAKWSGALG
jgi:hypothetical protein